MIVSVLLSLIVVVAQTTPLENPELAHSELAKKLLQAIPRFKRQVRPFNECDRCCCCLRCCCCRQPVVVVRRCCRITTQRICCQLSRSCCSRMNQIVVPQQLVPQPLPIPVIGQGVGMQLLPQILPPIRQVPSRVKGSVCCSCFGIGHGGGRIRNFPAFIQ